MNKEKQKELSEFLDWAKEYTNNKLDYGSYYLAQQYLKNSENLPISDVSEWVAVSDRTPICYMTGDWDGKMSDLLIVQDEKGKYHIANCYEYHDGQTEWYDQDDYGLRHVIMKWKSLE